MRHVAEGYYYNTTFEISLKENSLNRVKSFRTEIFILLEEVNLIFLNIFYLYMKW